MGRNDWLEFYDRNKTEEQKKEEKRQHDIWLKLNKLCPPGPGKAKVRKELLDKLYEKEFN